MVLLPRSFVVLVLATSVAHAEWHAPESLEDIKDELSHVPRLLEADPKRELGFSLKRFEDCLLHHIRRWEHATGSRALEHLANVQKRSDDIVKYGTNSSGIEGQELMRQVALVNFMHSAPLVNVSQWTPENWWKEPSSMQILHEAVVARSGAKPVPARDPQFLSRYHATAKRLQSKPQFNGQEGPKELPKTAAEARNFTESSYFWEWKVQHVARPFVEWVLSQPPASLEPLDLLRKAQEIYKGDVWTSLGVIGHVFQMSTNGPAESNRKALDALGARMKPVLVDDLTDPSGHHFHYWLYLNNTLQGRGLVSRTMVTYYEKMYQHDLGDYAIDKVAIDSGDRIRSKLKGQAQGSVEACR